MMNIYVAWCKKMLITHFIIVWDCFAWFLFLFCFFSNRHRYMGIKDRTHANSIEIEDEKNKSERKMWEFNDKIKVNIYKHSRIKHITHLDLWRLRLFRIVHRVYCNLKWILIKWKWFFFWTWNFRKIISTIFRQRRTKQKQIDCNYFREWIFMVNSSSM